jgi:phosphatidylglycerol:prolipoprotein diacylglycerol transferase
VWPDLFDLLGFQAAGPTFEVILWSIALLIGVWQAESEWRSSRAGEVSPLGWALSLGLIGFGLRRLYGTLQQGELYLGAVLLSLWQAKSRAALGAPPPAKVIDLALWMLVGGVVGARALGWLTTLPAALSACSSLGSDSLECRAIFQVWHGPNVFLGGSIGSFIAGGIWARRGGHSLAAACDTVAPGVAIGHAIGRIGCVAAGCCYGAMTSASIGISYPIASPAFADHYNHAAEAGREQLSTLGHSFAVHPSQLYDGAAELLICLFLIATPFGRNLTGGRRFALWAILYGTARVIIELFRGDTIRGYLFRVDLPWLREMLSIGNDLPSFLTTSQVISLSIISLGLWWFRRPATKAAASP